MVLCRGCIIKEIQQKRRNAKTDITLFKVSVVVGGIIGVLAIILGVFLGIVSETPLITTFTSLISGIGGAIVLLVVFSYGLGAGLIGLKKTVGWCWRSTIKIIPLTILAVIVFLVLFLFILAIGSVLGLIITPIILYRARNFLRDTAWVETLDPSYTDAPPPTAPTMANARANFCPNCGKTVAPEATFCIHCGKQI
jgi:hypothetical protein